MYQALYRKWRPRGWDAVAGQEHVTQTLKSQIASGRLSHAYLFVGTRGTGKTTCAKILSRAVNCEQPVDGSPCNVCATCIGIENGSILDVLELDAASNNGVDNVRALREEAVYTPASAKRRVYIIDEVHMLTASAFNALLKILEEPPEHLLFILATTELHKVPATILSRCQRFSFKRLSPEIIAVQLVQVAENEGLSLSPDAAEKLSRLADGSMRDALSLLDQCASSDSIDLARVLETIGLSGNDELLRIAGAVLTRNAADALSVLAGLFSDGRDMSGLLGEMAALFRDALVCKLSPDSPLLSGSFDGASLVSLTKTTPPERLFYCLETIKNTSLGLSRGGNARLSVETCLIKLCSERLSGGEDAILSRLSRLEGFIENGVVTNVSASAPTTSAAPATLAQSADERPPVNSAAAESSTAVGATVNENAATETPRIETPDMAAGKATTTPLDDSPGAAPDAQESSDFWKSILKLLRGDVAVYTMIGDKSGVTAELNGGTLTVFADNPFSVSMIESKTILEPLKDAAQKTLGRAVTVRVALAEVKSEDTQSKLERLAAFDIFKIEE